MTLLRLELLATQVVIEVHDRDQSQAVAVELAQQLGAAVSLAPARALQSTDGTLHVQGEPGAWLVEDGSRESATTTSEDLEPLLLAAITRRLVESSPLLGVHAGVLASAEGLVVIPGVSGHGKTTLVAACVQAGFGYLSDEVLAVDRASGAVHAFPRPLAIGHDVWEILSLDEGARPAPGRERLVPLAQLGVSGAPGCVRHVLLTERREQEASLTQVGQGQAVTALLGSAFNHFRDPTGSLHAVTSIARGASTWRACYRGAPELAELLRQRLGVP